MTVPPINTKLAKTRMLRDITCLYLTPLLLFYLKLFTASDLKHMIMYFDTIFMISENVKPIVDVHVLEVMKGSVLGSRLRNDDTVWTLHFKLILTESSGFDFPLRWLE